MKLEDFRNFFNQEFTNWFNKYAAVTFIGNDEECLKGIYDSWVESNRKAKYFWITQLGEIIHEDINANHDQHGNPIDVIGHGIYLKRDALIFYRNEQINKIIS